MHVVGFLLLEHTTEVPARHLHVKALGAFQISHGPSITMRTVLVQLRWSTLPVAWCFLFLHTNCSTLHPQPHQQGCWPPEHHQRIFDHWYRQSQSRSWQLILHGQPRKLRPWCLVCQELVTSKANNLWCLICSAADKPTHVRGIPNLEVSYSRSAATFRPVIKSVSRVGPTVGDDLLNCPLECVCIKSWLYIAKQALDGIPPELFFKDPFHQVCACCKQWVSNVVGAWQR